MEPGCRLEAGEMALVTREGLLLPDGRVVPTSTHCDFAVGSGWRFYYDEAPGLEPVKGDTVDPQPEVDVPGVPPVDAPAEAVPAAEHPAEAPVEHAAKPHATLPAMTGDDADLSQAIGAAAFLEDNPWAPVIMIVLAAIAVLGGRKAWTFYGEKSARAHELEMKKLEIAEKQAGLQGAQPPPCAVKQAETEARLAALEGRLGAVEKKGSMFGEFDPDEVQDLVKDLEKRLKRVERAPRPKSDT